MRETRVLNNEKGLAKFILVVGLLALGVYVGVKFGMPYYRYSAFKSDVVELARISLGDVAKTKTQVFERAQELRLPIEESDIIVTRTAKRVRVRADWSENVDLFGLYEKTLDFSVDEEE